MILFLSSLALADDFAIAPVDADPIINGTAATSDEFPMAGGILMDGTISFSGFGDQPLHSFICSSTLIAPDVAPRRRCVVLDGRPGYRADGRPEQAF